MSANLPATKPLIALIAGGLLLVCSLTACLKFISILIPPATDNLDASVVVFAIFLIIVAVVLLVVGAELFLYFGPRVRAEWRANQEDM